MINAIDSTTTTLLVAALDAASLRHQTIATNIANATVPGFVPRQVSFGEQWEAARESLRTTGQVNPATLGALEVQVQPVLDRFGAPAEVRLDAEVAEMAGNAVNYQALLKGLSRHMSLLMMAASDGKK